MCGTCINLAKITISLGALRKNVLKQFMDLKSLKIKIKNKSFYKKLVQDLNFLIFPIKLYWDFLFSLEDHMCWSCFRTMFSWYILHCLGI